MRCVLQRKCCISNRNRNVAGRPLARSAQRSARASWRSLGLEPPRSPRVCRLWCSVCSGVLGWCVFRPWSVRPVYVVCAFGEMFAVWVAAQTIGSYLSSLLASRARSVPPESTNSDDQGPGDHRLSCSGPHVCQHSLPRTDLHLYLSNDAADGLTGLPIGLCSLALRYLLPECEVERYLYCALSEAENGVNVDGDTRVRRLLTGSSSEGLSVPTFCPRIVTPVGSSRVVCDAPLSIPSPDTPPGEQPDGPIVTKSDTDCMFEIGFFPVSPERGSGRLYLDERGASHRGYVHVLWDPDWSPPPGDETASEPPDSLLRPLPCSDDIRSSPTRSEVTLCLSSDAVMQIWHEYNRFKGTVERHGPAINSVQLLHGMPIDFDSVPALRLTQPPAALRTWLKRLDERHAHWPPQEVRDSITTSGGGHLVATGHASSARRDLEWRLSFSVAEQRLSRTLTITQRKVYLLVKLVQKCFLARPKVLVTYHLKTLMFWELETTQHCWTEEHLFGRVLGLLDRIDTCLAERCVPSYFLPDNNLISDCSEADVAIVRRVLGLVRRDPLRSLFAIDSTVRFEFSTTCPLLVFHAPLLKAIAAGASSSSSSLAADVAAVAATGLVRQARDGIVRDEHTLARTSELLRDAFQLRQPSGAVTPLFEDWLLMTSAALFAATHRDEDIWVRDVLRVRATSVELAPVLTERHVKLWETVCPSGVPVGQQSPFLQLLRSCLDSYGDDLDRRAVEELFAEFIVSDRPHLPGDVLLTLMWSQETLKGSGDIPRRVASSRQVGAEDAQLEEDLLFSSQRVGSSLPGQCLSETERRDTASEVCSVTHGLVMDGLELSKPNKEAVVRKLIETGIPKSLAMRAEGDDLFSLKLAGWDEFGSANDDDDGRGYQAVHRFKLINSLEVGRQALLSPDIHATDLDATSTALLDTLGYLLLNSHYSLASRATNWLNPFVSKPTYINAETASVTYNLRRASRFLACLPEFVRSLLQLTPCQVSLPVVKILLMYSAVLLEAATAGEEETPDGTSREDRVVDLLAAWEDAVWCLDERRPELPDVTLLSDAVVKLCLVKLAGGTDRQCADCLTEVERRLDGQVTQHIRQALTAL